MPVESSFILTNLILYMVEEDPLDAVAAALAASVQQNLSTGRSFSTAKLAVQQKLSYQFPGYSRVRENTKKLLTQPNFLS